MNRLPEQPDQPEQPDNPDDSDRFSAHSTDPSAFVLIWKSAERRGQEERLANPLLAPHEQARRLERLCGAAREAFSRASKLPCGGSKDYFDHFADAVDFYHFRKTILVNALRTARREIAALN